MPRPPLLLLAGYLGLRAVLLVQPGYEDDLKAYRRWALAAAKGGVASVYHDSDMDYPPVYAYLLLPLGSAYASLASDADVRKGLVDPALWRALAKLPPLLFDLLTASLLFLAVRGSAGAASAWPTAVAGAYLTNPGVVFDTGIWGHPDSILGFLTLAAFLALDRYGPAPAFALLALATLMKPLGAPLFPLLALAVALRHLPAAPGPRAWRAAAPAAARELAVGGLAAATTAALIFLPFAMAGTLGEVAARIAGDLGAMPYTSVNAHNVWFLLGPWRDADAPVLGPLTPSALGLMAFGVVYLAVARAALRAARESGGGVPRDALLAQASLLAAAFFMLATHMHENHLFLALPLLTPLLPRGRAWQLAYVALSVGVLLNLALHDPVLPGLAPFSWGGDTGVPRPSHGRTFFGVELALVRLATALNVCAFAAFAALVLGPRGARLARPAGEGDHQDAFR
jgi:hypothetical protein